MQLLYKEQNWEESLAYLQELKPDKHTRLYNMGFVNDNGVYMFLYQLVFPSSTSLSEFNLPLPSVHFCFHWPALIPFHDPSFPSLSLPFRYIASWTVTVLVPSSHFQGAGVRVSFVFGGRNKALGHLPLYVIFLGLPPKVNTCYFFVNKARDSRGVILCFCALQRSLRSKGTG
jgi:hypothetical protein